MQVWVVGRRCPSRPHPLPPCPCGRGAVSKCSNSAWSTWVCCGCGRASSAPAALTLGGAGGGRQWEALLVLHLYLKLLWGIHRGCGPVEWPPLRAIGAVCVYQSQLRLVGLGPGVEVGAGVCCRGVLVGCCLFFSLALYLRVLLPRGCCSHCRFTPATVLVSDSAAPSHPVRCAVPTWWLWYPRQRAPAWGAGCTSALSLSCCVSVAAGDDAREAECCTHSDCWVAATAALDGCSVPTARL